MLILLWSLLFLTTAIQATPQGCTAMTNSIDYAYQDLGVNITAVTNYSITTDNTVTVTIDSLWVIGKLIQQICIQTPFQMSFCFEHVDGPVSYVIQNSTVEVVVFYVSDNPYQNSIYFDQALVDEGALLSGISGELFSSERPCANLSDISSSCCTAFKPVPEAPVDAPKCSKFTSRFTVYDTANNYASLMTSQGNYTFQGENLMANVSVTSDNKDWYIQLAANYDNDCSASSGSIGHCNFELPKDDGKMVFRLQLYLGDETLSDFFIGRIALRGNQTLMEEGKPFTKANDCFYFSQTFNDTLVESSSFCCSEF